MLDYKSFYINIRSVLLVLLINFISSSTSLFIFDIQVIIYVFGVKRMNLERFKSCTEEDLMLQGVKQVNIWPS